MLSSPQPSRQRGVTRMQFTTQTQQVITCPQCDNVVPIQAEFCNICGQRLHAPSTNTHPEPPIGTQASSTFHFQLDDTDLEYDDEEYTDEDEGESEQSTRGAVAQTL